MLVKGVRAVASSLSSHHEDTVLNHFLFNSHLIHAQSTGRQNDIYSNFTDITKYSTLSLIEIVISPIESKFYQFEWVISLIKSSISLLLEREVFNSNWRYRAFLIRITHITYYTEIYICYSICNSVYLEITLFHLYALEIYLNQLNISLFLVKRCINQKWIFDMDQRYLCFYRKLCSIRFRNSFNWLTDLSNSNWIYFSFEVDIYVIVIWDISIFNQRCL